MSKSLVVVESPTKARTIGRYIGKSGITVMSSMGHVRDLPSSSLGVDLQHGFKPQYVPTDNGKKILRDLRKAAKDADDIYLATDPDREGEAIAWHLREELEKSTKGNFHRVSFHEITPRAIQEAFEHPGSIADALVDAQQARRVLDRLVGYQVSPMLWREVKRGTSAGRVQSVALRLVCEREREILGFEPQEYWNMDAIFETRDPKASLKTRLALLDGSKPNVPNEETANALAGELETAEYQVSKVASKPRKQNASPPFITSTLQQAASSNLRIGTSQTMRIAQQLYEGVELGSGGPVGLITYMRTDSFNISQEAQAAAREFIGQTFGPDYVPPKPNRYRSRKSAQEAHEAIRPTDVTRTPESLQGQLEPRQLKLYRLIWQRFVASQMAPAKQLDHVIEIEARQGKAANAVPLTHSYIFRASARETLFPGYQTVYNISDVGKEDSENPDEPQNANRLPPLKEGLPCDLRELLREQCFTQPPKRYSEATLVRALEANGVGRPSTFAATVGTIQSRDYVSRDKGRLIPTELGFKVNDFLVERMPQLFDIGFTASMEEHLDEIEEGNLGWTKMLEDFYEHFRQWVSARDAIGTAKGETALRVLQLFPEDLDWDPPVKRGRRTYDDGKFHASLLEQVTEQKKDLSERQWKALLNMAARYADRLPGLAECAEELGLSDAIAEFQAAQAEQAKQQAEAGEVDPKQLAFVKVLDAVTEWAEPTKRGRRTYDDRKFRDSLMEQVEGGKALSPAQKNALKRLVSKYEKQIPNFEQVAQEFDIQATPAEEAMSEEESAAVTEMLAMLENVEKWAEPVKRGRRTYDDREFADSLRDQFRTKKTLSPRQIGALRKLLPKYAEQIPGFAEKAEGLGLKAKTEPKKLDVPCPECGKPMVERQSRRGVFYGCSGYPKCKYTANELPGAKDGDA
jgi:DNA topoisomerase-1